VWFEELLVMYVAMGVKAVCEVCSSAGRQDG